MLAINKRNALWAIAGALTLSGAQAAPAPEDKATSTPLTYDTHRKVEIRAVDQQMDTSRYLQAVKLAHDYWGKLWPENTYPIGGDLDGDGRMGDAATLTDRSAGEEKAPSKEDNAALEAWRNLLLLLARLGGAIQDLGLNGTYDGRITDPRGNRAEAAIDLFAKNGTATGTIWLLERGLSLDTGGIGCPTVDLPVSTFNVNAALNGNFGGKGGFERKISIGPFDATIYGQYTLTLSQNDYETLTVSLKLDVPSPCHDQTLTGVFHRRLDRPAPPPPPPTTPPPPPMGCQSGWICCAGGPASQCYPGDCAPSTAHCQ